MGDGKAFARFKPCGTGGHHKPAYSAVSLGVRRAGGRLRRAGALGGGRMECKRTATRPPQTRKAAPA